MSRTLSFLFVVALILSHSVSVSSDSNSKALMALNTSLDPKNQMTSSWSWSFDPCNGCFEGVACDELDSVVNISQQGKGLTGQIPKAIAGLKLADGSPRRGTNNARTRAPPPTNR